MTADWLSTTLPISAADAFHRFLAVDELPRWLPILRSARVWRRDSHGRPTRASFIAELERASVGYSLAYRYRAGHQVAWASRRGGGVRIAGRARFSELGPRACMMEYQLAADVGEMPQWNDRFFANHATSAVMAHFRDYVSRSLH